MRSILISTAVFFSLMAAAEYAVCDEGPVRIGVLAKRGKARCMEKWGPTADYLTDQIPQYNFVIIPLLFNEVLPAVGQGEVDFVITNPYYYVELEVMFGANRIVTLKNLLQDKISTVYGGVIFCRNDREDISELKDITWNVFMAPYEKALGGWVEVLREFREHGIDPYSDFAHVWFGDTQDAVVYAVRDGKADAGSVKTDTLERMDMEGKLRIEELKIINKQSGNEQFPFVYSTRLYPEWSFAKVKHTSEELAEKVGFALLGIGPDDPAAAAGRYAGWTFPLNYQSVHECLEELRLGPYKNVGRITPADVFKQYWYWFFTVLIFLIFLIIAVLFVTRLNRRLRDYQGRLRSLTAEVSLTAEKERRRIAIELHDRIGQNLALSKIKMDLMRESASSTGLKKLIKETSTLMEGAIRDTRLLTFDLSPPVLYELGFESALRWLSKQISDQHGIQIEFDSESIPDTFTDDIRIILFQSVRELLINVIKHAHADRVRVIVKRKIKEILIAVEDDGIGFKLPAAGEYMSRTGGFGLFSIRERLSSYGGTFKVEAGPDRGTRSIIRMPFDHGKVT